MNVINIPGSWSIVDDLFQWQDEFNRLFNNSRYSGALVRYPAINAWATKEAMVIDVELPGVDPAKVDVSLENDVLTITGSRENEDVQGAAVHIKERVGGEFRRSLNLPFRADAGKVAAKFHNGILRISLSRAEEDKPKKILIEAA